MFGCCAGGPRPQPVRRMTPSQVNERLKERLERLRPSLTPSEVPAERLKVFADVITTATDGDKRIEAFQTTWLMDLAHDSLKSEKIGSQERRYVTAMMFSLSYADDNREKMLRTNWLIDNCLRIAKEEDIKSDTRLYIIGMFRELALATENQILMFQRNDIIECLLSALRLAEPRSEIRAFALAALQNLASHEEIQRAMFEKVDTMNLIYGVLETEPAGSEILAHATALMWNLSLCEPNRERFLSTPYFTSHAEKLLKSEPVGAPTRVFCLAFLQAICFDEKTRVTVYGQKWILPTLERIIKEESDGSEVKQRAMGLLWSLALAPANAVDIVTSQRWLVILTKDKVLVKEGLESRVKADAYGFIWALARCDASKAPLMEMKRLMDLTEASINEEPGGSEVRAAALGFLAEIAKASSALVRMETLMKLLGRVIIEEPFSGSEGRVNAIEILMNLSLRQDARKEILGNKYLMDAINHCLSHNTGDKASQAAAFALMWNLASDAEAKSKIYEMDWLLKSCVKALRDIDDAKDFDSVANVLGLLQNLAGSSQNAIKMWRDTELMSGIRNVVDDQSLLLEYVHRRVPLGVESRARVSSTGKATTQFDDQEEAKVSPVLSPQRQQLGQDFDQQPNEIGAEQVHFETLVNGFGVLQNLAFINALKRDIAKREWILVSCARTLALSNDEAVLSACFGFILNLATHSPVNCTALLPTSSSSFVLEALHRTLKGKILRIGLSETSKPSLALEALAMAISMEMLRGLNQSSADFSKRAHFKGIVHTCTKLIATRMDEKCESPDEQDVLISQGLCLMAESITIDQTDELVAEATHFVTAHLEKLVALAESSHSQVVKDAALFLLGVSSKHVPAVEGRDLSTLMGARPNQLWIGLSRNPRLATSLQKRVAVLDFFGVSIASLVVARNIGFEIRTPDKMTAATSAIVDAMMLENVSALTLYERLDTLVFWLKDRQNFADFRSLGVLARLAEIKAVIGLFPTSEQAKLTPMHDELMTLFTSDPEISKT